MHMGSEFVVCCTLVVTIAFTTGKANNATIDLSDGEVSSDGELAEEVNLRRVCDLFVAPLLLPLHLQLVRLRMRPLPELIRPSFLHLKVSCFVFFACSFMFVDCRSRCVRRFHHTR